MRRCTKCRGIGSFIPPQGSTKADMVKCHICHGQGYLPKEYRVKPDTSMNRKKKYYRKDAGLSDLDTVEEV